MHPSSHPLTDQQQIPSVIPERGLHVIHGFYKIPPQVPAQLSPSQKKDIATQFEVEVSRIRSTPDTQLFLWSCPNPKADFGFMLLTPELHFADTSAKRLIHSLAALEPQLVLGYLSVTELSEYTTTESEYIETLQKQEGLEPGSPAFEQKLAEFKTRMSKYERDRLYPILPDWPVACFYPMSKLRIQGQNWFSLPLEKRKELMRSHGQVGRKYAGRVLQLITGSTGLDSMEWGVTLLARTTTDIKAIVYEMRFDPASAIYADFGDFFLGLSLPPHLLLSRLAQG